MSQESSQEIISLLKQYPEWEEAIENQLSISSLEILKKYLSKIIRDWTENDLELLAQTMYRIDVSEKLFREALVKNDAESIAELTINRQLQKIYFRKKYQSSQ